MDKPTVEKTEETDDDILKEARDRFQAADTADQEARLLAIEDIRFVNDEDSQWTSDAKKSRSGRPCMTFDQTSAALDQVVGDFLQNKPGIKVRPIDNGSDSETAEIYTGIIRNIESNSSAQAAYKTGFKFAATGGYGVWRITNEFNGDDSFEQDLKVKKLKNPFSCLGDPSSQETTKHDGRFWFVYESVTKSEFQARHPDADPEDVGHQPQGLNYEGWYEDDTIRIAEYYRKVPIKKSLCLLNTGETVDKAEINPEELALAGIQVVKEREADSHKIEWFKITGHQILERKDVKGKYIPIIPCYGKFINIEGEDKYRGLVRKAKDPQRSYNYHRSQIIETMALQPKAPWLYTPVMIAGHEAKWKKANTANVVGLPYNPDPSAPGGRPTREAPPAFPSGLLQEALTSKDDIKAATNIHDASLGRQSNETSGKAILARQREGDTANYEFTDNFSEALELTGRVLVDLIPYIYDTTRIVRILGEDEAEDFKVINEVQRDQEGNEIVVNDLSKGKYDVAVTTGASYSTRRIETAEQLTQVMQSNPQIGAIISDLWIDSLDLVGGTEAKERVRKYLLSQGLVEPNEEEQQSAQPTPEQQQQQQQEQQMQQMIQSMQLEGMQNENLAKKAKAAKDFADAKAQELETDLVESGVMDLVSGPDGNL